MRRLPVLLFPLALAACTEPTPPAKPASTTAAPAPTSAAMDARTLYDFSAVPFKSADPRSLAAYKGEVVLVVNTAANCGYTPQMGPLAELDKKYKDKRFRVAGFLSDDFGHQGGTTEEVTACTLRYGASFDEFAILHVKKGPEQDPLFAWLTSRPGLEGDVTWNFNKWLVGRDGRLVARWKSDTTPDSAELAQAIEKELAK
jgi:glutathione peroxidase